MNFTFCHNFIFDMVLFHTLMMIIGLKHEHNYFLIRLYEINFGFIKLYATTNLPNTYNHVESLWKVRNNNEWVRPESVCLQASESEGMQQRRFQCHWVHRSCVGKDTTADHIATWTRITENRAHSYCPYFQQHYRLWMSATSNGGPHLLFSVLYQDLRSTLVPFFHTTSIRYIQSDWLTERIMGEGDVVELANMRGCEEDWGANLVGGASRRMQWVRGPTRGGDLTICRIKIANKIKSASIMILFLPRHCGELNTSMRKHSVMVISSTVYSCSITALFPKV